MTEQLWYREILAGRCDALRWSRVGVQLAACWLFSCAQTTTPGAMGNTDWLGQCATHAECGDDAECACGVCTRECITDTDCHGVGQARCEPPTQPACGDRVLHDGRICMQLCDTDAECEGDLRCIEGACVAPERPAGIDAGVGYALARQGAEVTPTRAYRECERHGDCWLVSTGCDSCCRRGAISQWLREIYQENLALACQDYVGAICICKPDLLIARCEEGLCEAVPAEQIPDCFTPLSNQSMAYQPGSVGCRCDTPGEAICTDTGAYHCEGGGNRPRWSAVVDGVCLRSQHMCEDGMVTPSAEACLERFDECYLLDNGEYCGVR